MRTLLAIIGLIVLGALGTVGFLYAQEGSGGSLEKVLWQIRTTVGQAIPALAPSEEAPVAAAPVTAAPAPSPAPSPAAAQNTAAASPPSTEESAAESGPLKFRFPAQCAIGRNCLIQHFVDAEPGPEALDYKCGALTTPANQGLHLRLPGPKEMLKGVPVLAAAAGEVLRIRDGLPDVDVKLVGRDALGSSGYGNVVLLKHRDGYLSAYGHLKRGSITVAKGQQVRAGQKLGEIGLSGATDFPHLHFEVRRDGKVVDPFTGLEAESGCGKSDEPLWNQATMDQLTYYPSAILRIGFSHVELNQAALEYGLLAGDDGISARNTKLVFHVYAAGLRAGDKARFEIHGPSETLLTGTEETVLENSPTAIFRTGPPDLGTALEPGSYRGSFTLLRDENGLLKPLLTASSTVVVK